MRASDVHIEPTGENGAGRVRLRIDGMLSELEALDAGMLAPLVSRVKLLAGMDIADHRQPQDGRFTIEWMGRSLDARASSMPTIHGEKVVIRLLDLDMKGPALNDLGMRSDILQRYRRMIGAPYGFVIVTGPTGSGKTTTLYSSMREIHDDTRNICTVEDPVEMRMAGIVQVNVNQRAGLGFAAVVRSFLRQDPNVIMIGEMRDAETAAIATRAALSGQLVLTTLHSNDAPRAIERLIDLGVQRQAMAAALHGIVSQRLVRCICSACRGVGCAHCGGCGRAGRTGIFELLEIDDQVRDAIASGASIVAIRDIGTRHGYQPLFEDGLTKIAAGETTLDEVRRVAAWAT